MSALYLSRIQANPPGKDADRRNGVALQLNNEWVEFDVVAPRTLTDDTLSHNTYTSYGCTLTGTDSLFKFGSISLVSGHRVRVHTGSGQAWWEGSLLHVYAGRSWYVWNNDCGDRATLSYGANLIDWASYASSPREGILTRVTGTNRFI